MGPLRQQAGQGLGVQALLVRGHGNDLCLGQLQGLQRGRVGRHLDQHRIARLHQHLDQQVEGLLRARGHDHVGRRAGNAARGAQRGQGFAQRQLAFTGAVLQAGGSVLLQSGHRGLLQAFGIEQAGEG